MHWRLWNGGTTRLLLWADPEYVRRFAQTARLYDGDSIDVNEMLATKMLGEPHDKPPMPILTRQYRFYDYEFERYWHFYQVWGRVSYNPETARSLGSGNSQRLRTAGGPASCEASACREWHSAPYRRRELSLSAVSDDARVGGDDAAGRSAAVREIRGLRYRAVHESAR